jgi:hypothetical protein
MPSPRSAEATSLWFENLPDWANNRARSRRRFRSRCVLVIYDPDPRLAHVTRAPEISLRAKLRQGRTGAERCGHVRARARRRLSTVRLEWRLWAAGAPQNCAPRR